MKRMDALEQKLRTYSSTVFSLQDFIDSRTRESDYQGTRNQVLGMCKKHNQFLVEQVNGK
jgi:hypothetical protein